MTDTTSSSVRFARLSAWVAALRLHFYPVSWLGYGVGAAAATALGATFQPAPFWFGWGVLVFLEAATVLSNEYVDYPSDRRNRNHSAFTGGSRVLVDERLTFAQLRSGVAVALLLATACAAGLLATLEGPRLPVMVAVALMVTLTLGYTLPPLKLSYRVLGEVDVAVTTGAGVVLCGFVFQGAPWQQPLPWLLGASLGLAILPGITLAGIPDREADRAAGKRTLAVRFGAGRACAIAAAATVFAAVAFLLVDRLAIGAAAGGWLTVAYLLMLLHAGAVLVVVGRVARIAAPRRIDRAMILSLSFVIWFVAVPLLRLLG
ncbi:MAG: prenyltransferase [Pseudomonadales bacterium]